MTEQEEKQRDKCLQCVYCKVSDKEHAEIKALWCNQYHTTVLVVMNFGCYGPYKEGD
jgi:hypothetical protein